MSVQTVRNTWFTSVGSLISIVFSWSVNHSVLWAMLHFVFGWFYVIYWLLNYTNICAYVREYVVP